MDPARYLLTAGVPFVNPVNPGNTQQVLQQTQQQELEREEEERRRAAEFRVREGFHTGAVKGAGAGW